MALPVVFRRIALHEFRDAAKFYAAQRPGLGDEFIHEIERCVSLAAQQPPAYSLIHGKTRRITAIRFPFSIYFYVETERIVVIAIFHSSRNPAIWRERY
jgi:plasmid stabilization system protein ParE